MSKKYTLEDVEYIRARANVTYDEIIGLLDAYEGDVVRVMAELERAGKLHSKHSSEKSFGESLKCLLRKGYENRMIVKKDERVIANFSMIFVLIAVVFAFYVTIPALIFAIIFGYKVSFKKEPEATKDFSNIVYTTKKTAESFKNEFKNSDNAKTDAEKAQAQSSAQSPSEGGNTVNTGKAQEKGAAQNASQNPVQNQSQNPNQYTHANKDDDIIIE